MEIHYVCLDQVTPSQGERLHRFLRSAQICRRGSLLYPRKLRGMTPVPAYTFMTLTGSTANEGKQASNRITSARVEALAELLCVPVPEGDIKERGRRQRLEQ